MGRMKRRSGGGLIDVQLLMCFMIFALVVNEMLDRMALYDGKDQDDSG